MYNQSSSSSNFIDGIPPVPGGEGMWNAASRTISSPHQHTTRGSGSDISPQADGLTPGSSDGKGTKRDRPSNGMIAKKEEEGEPPPKKPKTTRGARACMVCRRLKMRCVPRMEDGVDVGPPCKRCSNGGHECIFEESQRGKRSNKKHDAMASSLKKMEQTLDVVLKSISHPGVMASSAGMLTGTPPIAPITLSPTTRPLPVAIDPRLDDDSRRGRSSTQPSVRDASREKPPSPRLHSLPDNTLNPLGLLAEASLQNSRKQQRKENESPLLSQNGEVAAVLEVERERRDDDPLVTGQRPVGLASKAYFLPTAMNILPLRRVVIESRMPPAILTEKIVTIEEAVALFRIYFEHIGIHNSFLDADFHTPTLVGSRSPFLFTVICAVAARFYTERKDLYQRCLTTAKKVAFEVLNKGYKSVEIVQGFLLLSLWNQPAERFEEDRTWAFLGIAIRMCTDLNLHRKSTARLPEDSDEQTQLQFERELLNRERTWLAVWIQDRSLSSQMGKPYSIPKEDFIIRNSRTWHRQRASSIGDTGIVAMVQLHRINTRILDILYSDTTTPSGLNPHLDYTMLLRTFSTQIDSWRDEWSVPIEALAQLRAPHYWAAIKMFYYHYYKLLLLSFGFQNALDKRDNENETIDLNGLFLQCFENASGIIRIGKDILGPRNHLRYATDAQFVFLSYAAVFLLKCIRPDFESICSETRLLLLVQEVIDLFESVAVDDTHTPALYAKFLKMLLEGRRGTGTRAAGTREGSLVAGQETNVVGQEGNALGLESVVKNFAIQQQPQGGMGMDMNADGGTFVNGNANGSFNLATDAEMDNFLDQQGLWNNFLFPGFGSQFELSAGGAAFGGLPMENAPWDVGNMSGGGGMGAWTPGEMESGTFASWS
ncbi:hypothetical protein BT69DRAFT_1285999 [Atractiella rhizophila]|nr:hypothetical protein BT69DRAFT_1285999 [Atractiella rhizophila]